MSRILGIDTGTNSLGWAVVEKHDNGVYELLRKGSLIFQEGVKIEKGNESSKAAERTQHRAVRRHYFRRRLRKIEVLKVLIKYGWCPALTDEQLYLWHTKKIYPESQAFMEWQRTNENSDVNPYYYRHICLHDGLDLDNEAERYMLGRALYHLAQRRGFLSNRLDKSEEKETGVVKNAISDLSQQMADAGQQYLGDYFYDLYQRKGNTVRIRTRYTDREKHYKAEFYAICQRQGLSDEQVKELERALYFQRPLKSQRMGVGKCTFEPRKPRCIDSHPDYEEYRMLSFINNIKVCGPNDTTLRPLNAEEVQKILPIFFQFRKKKSGSKKDENIVNFNFEEIEKAIAGKKGNYQHIKEPGTCAYKFNYRHTQSVAICPTIAKLRDIFGDDYEAAIAEVYTKSRGKTPHEMVCDVWNVLNSFSDEANLMQWAKDNLQLDEAAAVKFSKIKLSHDFASLSLCAIRKILPFLREGMIYSHAVLLAKIPDIIGQEAWERDGERIKEGVLHYVPSDEATHTTLYDSIREYLLSNYELEAGQIDALYHPSMIETYHDAKRNADGVYQLGSPRTNAVRNPMAMRSLHQLRRVINQLLRDGIIDHNTEVHVEYARELADANKRWAIGSWNEEREKKRKKYREAIIELYKNDTDRDIEPTEADIEKYELWEEQDHKCLYTGNQIGITDFVGKNPRYDIEHTIPRSKGGDSTMMNKTLCESHYNRDTKKGKMPTELADHAAILNRIEPWKKKIDKLSNDIVTKKTHSGMDKGVKDNIIRKRHKLRLELDYWQGKYNRFTMTEVPKGFSLRQGTGIGLISKYAGLYLKSLFHPVGDNHRSNVRAIKGATTAEYRKMWGIQDEYEKKSRDNHVHHCIDAITIACISTGDNNATACYYKQLEEYERTKANKPMFPKPWPTFTEDIKKLADEMVVVHDTPDNMPKRAKRYVRTASGKHLAQGDAARGLLHKDTNYGAIERNGKIKYVVRRPLDTFTSMNDIEKIVDEAVREKVRQAVEGKDFKTGITWPIYMNDEKGIRIKKVRCYAILTNPIDIRHHRDASDKAYKQQIYVAPDTNYCMAIYEGEVKGKVERKYEVVNMLDAAHYYKESADLTAYYPLAPQEKDGLPYRCLVRKGTQVIFLQSADEVIDIADTKSLAKRLYYLTGIETDCRITFQHNQEARESSSLPKNAGAYNEQKAYRPIMRIRLKDFHALVEGVDFDINVLGEIKLRNR